MSEKYTYKVEVIYNKIYLDTNEEGKQIYKSMLSPVAWDFIDANKSIAKQEAEKYMAKILRDGMVLRGGSVIKQVITPTCLLTVSLVDDALFQRELEEGLGDINVDPLADSTVTPTVPSETEALPTTAVELDETS